MSDLSAEILRQLSELAVDVGQLKRDLSAHMAAEEHEKLAQSSLLNKISDEVEALNSVIQAIPHLADGTPDFRGHRHDHESRRDDGIKSSNFWQALRIKAGEHVVTGIMMLLVVGYLSWVTTETDKYRHSTEDKSQASSEQLDQVMQLLKNQEAAIKSLRKAGK